MAVTLAEEQETRGEEGVSEKLDVKRSFLMEKMADNHHFWSFLIFSGANPSPTGEPNSIKNIPCNTTRMNKIWWYNDPKQVTKLMFFDVFEFRKPPKTITLNGQKWWGFRSKTSKTSKNITNNDRKNIKKHQNQTMWFRPRTSNAHHSGGDVIWFLLSSPDRFLPHSPRQNITNTLFVLVLQRWLRWLGHPLLRIWWASGLGFFDGKTSKYIKVFLRRCTRRGSQPQPFFIIPGPYPPLGTRVHSPALCTHFSPAGGGRFGLMYPCSKASCSCVGTL